MLKKKLVLSTLIACVLGHGRLILPPGRSSMWRYGYNTPVNYNDMGLYCGGFYNQWTLNGGKCGMCGDPWNSNRDNEAGGKYATGTIVGRYFSGQTIQVKVEVTASHRGYFEFRLCPVNNPLQPTTQACFDQNVLRQPNGQIKFNEPGSVGTYAIDLVLPQDLTCTQCVLQWKWNTGNSFNCDENHNCCLGCGPQEQYYGCADIAIFSSSLTYSFSASFQTARPIVSQGGVMGFSPNTSPAELITPPCEATTEFKARYPYADQYCISRCKQNICPSEYCTKSCRNT